MNGAEVAQIGRALDSTKSVVEGEAEDRVVAGSSPAFGTIMLILDKPTTKWKSRTQTLIFVFRLVFFVGLSVFVRFFNIFLILIFI